MFHETTRFLLTVFASLTLLIGCSSDPEVTPDSGTTTPEHSAGSTTPATDPDPAPSKQDRENIGFKTGAGERLYEIKFKADGAKLVDSDEMEMARFKVDGKKVTVKLPDETVAAYIIVKDREFQVRDESQKVELFELKSQSDGDWKLKGSNDQLLAVIKKRDYGYEVEDAAERSLLKSKLKDGKYSLRDAEDNSVLYTKDAISPLSVACLGLEQIESLAVRTGLATTILLFSD